MVSMAGVDYRSAPLALREKTAFDTEEVKRINIAAAAERGVDGCVVISTCNRTEIYVCADTRINAAELLFCHSEAALEEFKDCMYEYYDYDAALHLSEVACGLHSAILCEEQIVTQVGDAVRLSRECGCSNPALNTMFRCAVTAGKRALTDFSVRAVPLSAAAAAVRKAERLCGTLGGKSALVIGNGQMGRIAAEELLKKGCGVHMTLRQYRHGENSIPDGARTVDYADRMARYEKSDLIITATRSPHYTIQCSDIDKCKKHPYYIFDLAVPRDVEPGTEKYTRVFTTDDLTETDGIDKSILDAVYAAAKKQADEFARWNAYRSSANCSGRRI